MSDTTLKGKTVLVTGGAKNLGGAISRDLAAAGASVAVHYHSRAGKGLAEETVAACVAAGGDAFAVEADLTSVAEIRRVLDAVLGRYGALYATVNTAGLASGNPMTEVSEDEYDAHFAVNAKAAFFLMAETARRIDDGGRIVTFVSSLLAAYTGRYSVYAGSKAPVEHFTRALSKELAGRRVSVNNLAPGPMDTSFFWDAAAPGEAEYSRAQTPYGELTKVEHVVPWVRFLLTDGWWLNGQTVFLNGGFSTR
ncbi:Short-chain dehydrogenase/reductase SDR [[Actinomadura] parvosata subsp. kistnae]|uniref:Short-chain dehydrogenase n=1 Tax=[Actinomadura] parvosata subsp. kistnae TaxID=1909395 RepID=A0A1U9ZV13_9ACTN|nr:SDR family oxidoreductase [Nonomuraea sp. ATCC 55076]AQZ61780.1 short-chain dehydrogenase [Nonomuraea sp. ATCC 55076]SPL87905.1 Short-chain dehydrogenase/reductase SDR [Actinomadura parvosata subsp. kistnae]